MDDRDPMNQEVRTATHGIGWRTVSRLSHTFRTPLNHVLGFAEILESRSFGPLNERQLAYVQKIQTAGHRQLALIDKLVDIARAKTAEFVPVDDEWDVRNAVYEVVESKRAFAATRDVELVTSVESPARVQGDFDRFCQVLHDLLAYAIQRSSREDVVTVTVVTDDTQSVPTLFNVSVVDAGPPPTTAEQHLLEHGQVQSDGQLGDIEGLGLLHAHVITAKLGGTLSWRTMDGRGLTTQVAIPLSQLVAG